MYARSEVRKNRTWIIYLFIYLRVKKPINDFQIDHWNDVNEEFNLLSTETYFKISPTMNKSERGVPNLRNDVSKT